MISSEENKISVEAYGAENEPADRFPISLSQNRPCRINISENPEDFCIAVRSDNKMQYYRLNNDAFYKSRFAPKSAKTVFELKSGKQKAAPTNVYNLINSLTEERIEHIPYDEVELPERDKEYILKLLLACADLYEYSSLETDIDALTLKVLYSHQGFRSFTDANPHSSAENNSLKLCSEEYISNVIYNVFRRKTVRPAVNMLTENGYCYNNGFYYYYGGYTDYFKTEIHDIVKAFKTDKDTLFVVFSDTYTEAYAVPEYSCAELKKDRDGYYITALRMGSDFKTLPFKSENNSENKSELTDEVRRFLPILVILLTLAACGIVIYFYIF